MFSAILRAKSGEICQQWMVRLSGVAQDALHNSGQIGVSYFLTLRGPSGTEGPSAIGGVAERESLDEE